MRKSIIIGVVVLLVVILVAAYFASGWLVYSELADVRGTCDKHRVNTPDHFTNVSKWPGEYDFSPWFVPEYELVTFPSRQEGIEIAGYWMEGGPDAPAVVVLDGIGGCKQAQAALLPAGMLWRNGFNVLVIDLRDTGDSGAEDGYSALGNEEYLDALGAWDWLTQEKGFAEESVGIMGNSLGAATVLVAFQEEPRVAAVAVNSPFANLPQIIREQLVNNGFPAFIAPAIPHRGEGGIRQQSARKQPARRHPQRRRASRLRRAQLGRCDRRHRPQPAARGCRAGSRRGRDLLVHRRRGPRAGGGRLPGGI